MISIIVASYNEEKNIRPLMESLLNQDYKGKYEIIVVDSGTDRTSEILSEFPVKLIRQEPKGPAAARNLGVSRAKGEIVVFIDADCIAPKNWLKTLTKPFENKDIAGVGGTYKTANKESVIARFTGYEIGHKHHQMAKLERINFMGSFNCAYRKDIFQKFGGFNINMIQAEDADLSLRISKEHKLVLEESAFVYHYHPDSLKQYLKIKIQRGYWRVRLIFKHQKRAIKNDYASLRLPFQVGFTGLFGLFMILSVINPLFIPISFLFLGLSFIFDYKLLIYIFERDKKAFAPSIGLIFLRNVFVIFGILKSLKEKIIDIIK